MKTKFSIILLAGALLLGQSCKEKSNTDQSTTNKSSANENQAEVVAVNPPVVMKVTSAVAMRGKPDLKGKKVKCTQFSENEDGNIDDGVNGWECTSGCQRETAYAPKGTIVTVEAKTKGKLKVKKWQNHWYRVTLEDLVCPEKKDIWIFGEFVN